MMDEVPTRSRAWNAEPVRQCATLRSDIRAAVLGGYVLLCRGRPPGLLIGLCSLAFAQADLLVNLGLEVGGCSSSAPSRGPRLSSERGVSVLEVGEKCASGYFRPRISTTLLGAPSGPTRLLCSTIETRTARPSAAVSSRSR